MCECNHAYGPEPNCTDQKEVFSVPAGNSFHLATQYAVYNCAASQRFRQSLYVTFRDTGSVMDRLFLRKATYLLPSSLEKIENSCAVPDDDKAQILAYLKAAIGFNLITEFDPTRPEYGRDIKVIVLHRDRIVWLPNKAKMANPCVAKTYYALRELLDPSTAPSVHPESQEND